MLDVSIPTYHAPNQVYGDIYEQYANEASFLWLLRSISVNEPHNDTNDLLELEKRIDEQLDGLMTSMDVGWQVCEEALDIGEPGEVFTALMIGMRSHDIEKIKIAVEAGFCSKFATSGLISAMGWLPDDIANSWIERFLSGKDLQHKFLGVAACSVRRHNPADALITILKREDCQQHTQLYARALRLVGELRRLDCLPLVNAAINSTNEDIKFWANWSSILLGNRGSVNNLKSYIFKSCALQDKAIHIAFRVLSTGEAREWISELSQDKKQVRAVIKSIGVLGDPHAVNWLINRMDDSLYAKLAGESFSYITGVDLEKSGLSMKIPDDNLNIPNDNVDDDIVALDEDENLLYPNVEKVISIWQKYGQKFLVGKRYFLGQPITVEFLQEKIRVGMQRKRHAAALELALHENGLPLVNTNAKILRK